MWLYVALCGVTWSLPVNDMTLGYVVDKANFYADLDWRLSGYIVTADIMLTSYAISLR